MASFSQPESTSSNPRPLIKPYPYDIPAPPELPDHYTPYGLTRRLRITLGGVADNPVTLSGCEVWSKDDVAFKQSSTIFNGAVKTHALILVRPKNALEVSKIVLFCREHGLEISIKAGGYGTHGWSVAGHLILDLSLLNQISISLPNPSTPTLQESFEQLDLDRVKNASTVTPAINVRPAPGTYERVFTGKRTADEAWSDDDSDGRGHDAVRSRGKKRMEEEEDLNPPLQRSSPGSGGSVSRSDSDGIKDPDGDMDMVDSGSSEMKDGSSGHGSTNGSNNRYDARTGSTTGTSFSSDRGRSHRNSSNDGEVVSSPTMPPRSGSSSGGHTPLLPRTTYVNPSPIATGSFPFVTTSFGGSSATSNSVFSNLGTGFLRPSHLALNTHPDPPPFTIVTFGAGATSKQIDAITAASPHGAFHIPTSAFPVGSGQFVSGGFGFIGRKYGLAMDNVVEAEMVLADGRIVWVGENGKKGGQWRDEEDPEEVWWAIRGAGAVLGVVTRFRAKAYYVPSVYAGNFIYMFDRETTPSLLRHVRDCIKGSPRGLYANIILTAGPPGAPAIVVIQLCFTGNRSEGEMYVQTIGSWDGGRCLFQDFSERTFEKQQLAVEEVLKGGVGRRWYIKSDLLTSLTDEVVDETCARFHAVPDGCTWLFEFTGGGAVVDVKDTCFPISHRESAFTVAALHQWGHDEPPDEDNRCITTAEDWINEVITPHSPGGPLPCFLQSATEKAVMGVYGVNYPRLKALKDLIDPDNFYRHTMWPHPGAPCEKRQMGLADGKENNEIDGITSINGYSTNGEKPALGPSTSSTPDKGKMKESQFSSNGDIAILDCQNSATGVSEDEGIREISQNGFTAEQGLGSLSSAVEAGED